MKSDKKDTIPVEKPVVETKREPYVDKEEELRKRLLKENPKLAIPTKL